jgi:hypothetical protein
VLSTLPPAPIIHLATPPILSCNGCSTTDSKGLLVQCEICKELPPMKLILEEAKAKVAEYITNAAEFEGMDPFLLVIEDEFGGLVHTQGDLSFLMPSTPVAHEQFAKQLNPPIQRLYAERQLAVWKEMLRNGEQFQIAPGWNVCILPMLAEDSEFTVTIFFNVS